MLVVSAVAGLALAGCGEEKIDAGKAEEFVRDTARAPELIEDVRCPDGLEAKEGQTFDCTIVVTDGSEEVITLRQYDDEGHVEPAGNRQTKAPQDREDFLILPENVESLIRSVAPSSEELLSVDCPSDVKVRKGNDFDCVGRLGDGTELLFHIKQRDDLGNVELAGTSER